MKVVNIILVCLASLLLSVGCANAVGFGASPATLSFDISKGGYAEQTLTVSTLSEEPLKVAVSISKDIANFVSYSPHSNLKVSKGSPLEINIRADAPAFAENGVYSGTITTGIDPSAVTSEGTGSAIATGVAIKTTVHISDKPISSGSDGQTTVPLSAGGAGTILIFAVIIVLGCIAVVAVKVLKKRRKSKEKNKKKK